MKASQIMAYELWNRENANIVGEFDTEDEALAFVRDMVDAHGADVVLPWALAYEETRSIAIGVELLSWAQKPVPA
jgi:hypothetical protein